MPQELVDIARNLRRRANGSSAHNESSYNDTNRVVDGKNGWRSKVDARRETSVASAEKLKWLHVPPHAVDPLGAV